MPVFTATAAGASCRVRATPRAGRTAIAGVRDGMLLVKLAAAPADGAANDALVGLLSDVFGLPRRAIAIAAGDRSRNKRVEFRGASASALDDRLAALLAVSM